MFHSLSVLHSCLKYTYIYINKKIYVCVYFFYSALQNICFNWIWDRECRIFNFIHRGKSLGYSGSWYLRKKCSLEISSEWHSCAIRRAFMQGSAIILSRATNGYSLSPPLRNILPFYSCIICFSQNKHCLSSFRVYWRSFATHKKRKQEYENCELRK